LQYVVFTPAAVDVPLRSVIFVLPTLNRPQRFGCKKTKMERCGILGGAKVPPYLMTIDGLGPGDFTQPGAEFAFGTKP
jgi:hypothetical protein